MNREEFMRQLESLLQDLPATERERVIRYYEEYFEDAGPENEQNVIEALGNPAKVAGNIEAVRTDAGTQDQKTWQDGEQSRKAEPGTARIVLIVLLCILASPVILGVASAGIGLAAGVIAGWFGLIIGFGVTAIVLLVVWLALFIAGIIGLFHQPFVGMGLMGAGLLCGGVGLLFLMLTVAMTGIATPAICHWIAGWFQKDQKQGTAGQTV